MVSEASSQREFPMVRHGGIELAVVSLYNPVCFRRPPFRKWALTGARFRVPARRFSGDGLNGKQEEIRIDRWSCFPEACAAPATVSERGSVKGALNTMAPGH